MASYFVDARCCLANRRWHSLAASWALAVNLFAADAPSPTALSNRLSLLTRLVQDPSPSVRAEALRSLASIRSAEAASISLSVLNQPMDAHLDYSLWLTINDLAEPWISAVESGEWSPVGREKQLEFALRAIKPDQASRVLGKALARQPLSRDGQGPWIELIGSAGSPKELRQLLDQTLADGFDASATSRALRALGNATRLRKVKPSGSLSEISQLLNRSSPEVQAETLKLGSAWKLFPGQLSRIAGLASSTTTTPEVRSEALNALLSVGGPEALTTLSGLTSSTQPLAQRLVAIGALARLDLGRAIPSVVDVAKLVTDETAAVELWRSVLPVKGAGKAVAAALPQSGIAPAVARAGMRVAREGGRNDLELVAALAKAGGLSTDTQTFNAQLIQDLATRAAKTGVPGRGEMIYRRAELACITCHAIGGAGGKVGPDLTSIGASAPSDYLVESLVFPNAKIKEGYHSIEITTKDATDYTGTLARETPQEVILRNAAGAEMAIAKNDIAKRSQAVTSLMPAGLLEPLNDQELLDLTAFLSQLGKPGPFDASRGGVARTWYVGNLVHTDVQNGKGDWAWTEPITDKRWTRLSSLVNGRVTRPLLEEATRASVWTGKLALLAATEIEVSKAGTIALQLECPPGPELWVDGRKVGSLGRSSVELAPGIHRVLLRIPPQHVPDSFQLTSPDATFVLK